MAIIMPTWNLRWRGPFSGIANYTVSFADVFIAPIVAGILEIRIQKFEEWSLSEFKGCIYHCIISTEQIKLSPVAQIFQV